MGDRDENILLEKIGLTHKERLVYEALLGSPSLSVSDISKKTGLHRPTIYQTVIPLRERGLISLTLKGKQKRYTAESPEKLKRMLNDLSLTFETLLPNLQQRFEVKGRCPEVKFLEGKEGIRFVFDDIVRTLHRGDIFYRYSSSRAERKSDDVYLPASYRAVRDQKQLERFVITNETKKKQLEPKMERAVKTVPPEYGLFDYNITQIIYGDKMAFVDYNTETAFIIENAIIAEFQRKIFKLLYDKL